MMSHYKTGEEIEVNLIDNKNPKGNLIIDCTPLVQNLDRRGSKILQYREECFSNQGGRSA